MAKSATNLNYGLGSTNVLIIHMSFGMITEYIKP